MAFEVLGSNKKRLTMAELSKKVLATGYKTCSAKFEYAVCQSLYNIPKEFVYDARRGGIG